MSTVRSADGTTIAYTRAGQGPPLILVDGALCSRSFGPMPKLAGQLTPHFTVYTYDRRGRGSSGDPPYSPDREIEDIEALVALAGDTVYLHGTSSGAALALRSGQAHPLDHETGRVRAAVHRRRHPDADADDYLPRLKQLVADGPPGNAVKMFMRFVGAPAMFIAVMPITPVWASSRRRRPLSPTTSRSCMTSSRECRSAGGMGPSKGADAGRGGWQGPDWMANGTRALAAALPDATYRTLPGQNHMVKAQAIAPVLTEFFTIGD